MKQKKLSNGFIRLTPKKGHSLYNTRTEATYTDVIVTPDKVKHFIEK